MQFDLKKYEDVLQKQVRKGKLSPKTAIAYMSCMERLSEYCIRSPDCSLSEAIVGVSGANEQVPKIIAAVKKYERDVMDNPKCLLYGHDLQKLRQDHKQREIGRPLALEEKSYLHKINALRNKKLKLAFRLQYRSGLRISEVAALTPDDITFGDDGNMTLFVRSGKGRKSRTVDVMDDDYLYQNLKELSEESEGTLFYSASYMQKKAAEHNLLTHDLRRINSKERFRKELENGSSRRAARREVQQQFGHGKPRITSAYLGTDWEEVNENE